MLTLSDSKLHSSFDDNSAPSVSCQSCLHDTKNWNQKLILGAEIDYTIFANFHENRSSMISNTSIVHSLIMIIVNILNEWSLSSLL
jgi:hypothetical protein